MKPVFDIVAEPKGQTYFDLLDFLASRCESFSLVWRDQFRFEYSAYEIENGLKPFLISAVRTHEWPGTKLIGHRATVRRYLVSEQSVQLLQRADSLYSWLEPNLPEDLAFYNSGDVVWFASTSHEREAWFLEESLREAEINIHVPGIQITKHRGW